jgi:hypothetical protein
VKVKVKIGLGAVFWTKMTLCGSEAVTGRRRIMSLSIDGASMLVR